MSEPYDPKLFVGRNEALQQIEQWVNNFDPSHRIFSLTGPPGIGKSWVIAKVYQKLYAVNRRVFVLNLSPTPLLADADAYPKFVKIKGPVNAQQWQKYIDWLNIAIEEAKNHKCPHVEELDPTLAPERSLEKLIEALCLHCADPAPVLIVDGYEDLSPEEGDWLQENFLKLFLARQCSLLIITRRDEKWLQMSSIRLVTSEDALMLQPLSEAHGKEQIQKRIAHKSPVPNPDVVQGVYDSIPGYKQTHPKINAVLMDLAIEKEKAGHPGTLTYEDMQNCIRNFTLPLNISDDALSKLEKLAKVFPGEFSLHELLDRVQINLNELQELFELGLLQNGISKHTIPEGIYELAKAMANLAP